ncbi:MAG: hypothetical protein EPO39_00670 [Candidatus Manganitrophaceae bacterium]|nr:MAG: hypothetical protein EPO39_00670 [Candidatus Manganitrophaceae bacterium]
MGSRVSWIDDEKTLALGCCPTDGDVNALVREGISAILSLQEHLIEGTPASLCLQGVRRLAWANVPIQDGGDGGWDGVPTVEGLAAAVAQIRRWHQEGRRVYLHCRQGIGRAPIIAIAYLILARGVHIAHAIARVVERHPKSDPSVYQIGVLAEYVRQIYEAGRPALTRSNSAL